jgi:uncharacterized protein (DUF488 family)
MKNLYDLGYLEIKKLEKLVNLVGVLDAVLVDVRFSPNSRNPQWRQAALKKALGDRYIHVKALGNKNHKGGPIEFLDLQGGMDTLAHLTQNQKVIIMCACSNRAICHRVKIAETFEEKYDQKSIPLTDQLVSEIIGSTASQIKNTQLSLF